MELYLKTLLFLFLKFCMIHGQDPCPSSSCGDSTLKIHYPFKLESQTPTNNCTYFNLTCTKNDIKSSTILSLPRGGDFYVDYIDYYESSIQLYDPGNCLMKRIMNFSLDSSPFKMRYSYNYTFYLCASDSNIFEYMDPIECLSNSTNKTFATPDDPDLWEGYGCQRIGSWLLPIQEYGMYNESSLFLIWDAKVCKDCQPVDHNDDDDSSDPKRTEPVVKLVAVAMSMPALTLLALSCCSAFCLHLVKRIGKYNEADLSAPIEAAPTTIATTVGPPPGTNETGLDESKIKACTELIVLSKSDESIPSGNINMCSICLDNYSKNDTVSVISKCGHCFHASCIQLWLGKNGTCPVCRTSLSDAAL